MSYRPLPERQPVALAATHDDPDDALLTATRRVIGWLQALYSGLVVLTTPRTGAGTLALFDELGVRHTATEQNGIDTLGLVRLEAVRRAAAHAPHVHLCDWDRLVHWAAHYPDELRATVATIPRYDLLILGRTPRAWNSHPRVQRETEALVNHVFGLAFGQALDVTAAARGLSQAALAALLELPTPEATIGNDCAWPLHLARQPTLTLGYLATEGLEWETPDRYAEQIAAAGGLEAWIAAFDSDPAHWEFRLRLAWLELAAINRWR